MGVTAAVRQFCRNRSVGHPKPPLCAAAAHPPTKRCSNLNNLPRATYPI